MQCAWALTCKEVHTFLFSQEGNGLLRALFHLQTHWGDVLQFLNKQIIFFLLFFCVLTFDLQEDTVSLDVHVHVAMIMYMQIHIGRMYAHMAKKKQLLHISRR